MIYNFGINDSDYAIFNRKTNWTCPYYTKWKGMLRRVLKDNRQAYLDVEICLEWKYFSNFKLWMEIQDWENKELDKDLLKPGNKLYSPETCYFVPKYINSLLTNKKKSKLPIGVNPAENEGQYIVQMSQFGKRKFICRTYDLEEATLAYKKARNRYLLQIMKLEKDEVIKNALKGHLYEL